MNTVLFYHVYFRFEFCCLEGLLCDFYLFPTGTWAGMFATNKQNT